MKKKSVISTFMLVFFHLVIVQSPEKEVLQEKLLTLKPVKRYLLPQSVKVNGKEIKKILVDGKEFFSDDRKIASKNLPAKMVDKLKEHRMAICSAEATETEVEGIPEEVR